MSGVPAAASARADRVSVAVLVAANLLPVAGVLALGWKVEEIVVVYWVENLVIGLFNAVRMAMAQGTRDKKGRPVGAFETWFLRLFMVPFFIVHYGGFCFGHGVFLATLFPPGGGGQGQDLDDVLLRTAADPAFLVVAAALFASHAYSFARHYVGGAEYRSADINELMARPYKRIIVVHLFIIGGGLLMLALKSPLPALMVFIALKVAVDAWSHSKERSRAAAASSVGPARALKGVQVPQTTKGD